MRTELAERFGIDYPIFGFTPSQHVAAAISRAGGMGVLGCVRFNEADELDEVLEWMHENTDGKPFGVDIVMPAKIPTEGSQVDLDSMIPPEHKAFVERTLDDLGVPPLPNGERVNAGVLGWLHSVARSHVDVAMEHTRKYGQIKLIANALGSPPEDVIATSHDNGLLVAALAGAKEHALHHVEAGVDIVILRLLGGSGAVIDRSRSSYSNVAKGVKERYDWMDLSSLRGPDGLLQSIQNEKFLSLEIPSPADMETKPSPLKKEIRLKIKMDICRIPRLLHET